MAALAAKVDILAASPFQKWRSLAGRSDKVGLASVCHLLLSEVMTDQKRLFNLLVYS